jgi:methylthioribose-1-phosphate isomerase
MTDLPRAVSWTGTAIQIIDQTALPAQLKLLIIEEIDDLVGAIQRLAVRGAPALGAIGGLGVVLALAQAQREGWTQAATDAAIDASGRPAPPPWTWLAVSTESATGSPRDQPPYSRRRWAF